MEPLIDTARSTLETLLKCPSILLFALVLNIVGWLLKKTTISNRAIPAILIALAACIGPSLLLEKHGWVNVGVPEPGASDLLRRICVSIIVGFVAWGLYETLFKYLERLMPGLNANDTDIITKQKVADADDK